MKVGDYVRIKTLSGQGKIAKLEKIDDICITDNGAVDRNNIIKSSPNIIDLIEVGDYVNGLKVTNVGGTYHGRKDKAIYCDYCEDKKTGKWTMIYDDEIKSIVTKEQFESMEYRIESE